MTPEQRMIAAIENLQRMQSEVEFTNLVEALGELPEKPRAKCPRDVEHAVHSWAVWQPHFDSSPSRVVDSPEQGYGLTLKCEKCGEFTSGSLDSGEMLGLSIHPMDYYREQYFTPHKYHAFFGPVESLWKLPDIEV